MISEDEDITKARKIFMKKKKKRLDSIFVNSPSSSSSEAEAEFEDKKPKAQPTNDSPLSSDSDDAYRWIRVTVCIYIREFV